MKILGCDLHAKQQTIAMVDTETGEFTEKTLSHEGNEVREFYAALEGPVVVGIEATGSMQWFLELLEELGIGCRVGHPAKIRAAETRKQKHDRRDARLMLDLLMREDGFPEIWMPSSEQRDLRTLLRDRHQWVKIRTRVPDSVGTPLGTMQSLLGHSTPEIKREIYLHAIPEEQRRAVESVERLVFGPKWTQVQPLTQTATGRVN